MKPAVLAAFVLGVCALATPLHAQHNPAAHEHGVAALRVVSDGAAVLIEFVSPLDNLVGFEHAPRTDAQREALRTAEARLRDGARLFQLSGEAGCQLRYVAVDSPWPQDPHHAHAPEQGHGNTATAPAHEGHAELVASYRFECAAIDRLASLKTALFDTFPRLRTLRAERATASGQGAQVLSRGKAALPL